MRKLPRVLVVEDEAAIAELIAVNLRHNGFAPTLVFDGHAAQLEIDAVLPDVILLDWMLPGESGATLARQWRKHERTKGVPIIMLTARSDESDKVQGLDAGADDYMVKPFELPELLARLRALLRRSQAATTAVLSFGPLELDTAGRRASIRSNDTEQVIDLGPREWTVLEYLLIHAPKPASKDKLLQALTGWDKEITPNAVEVYVSRLRGKLEPHGVALRSIRGFGYRLELQAQ